MSRIPDLLNLIQNANDFYLVNPERNKRSVFIQVDNLCELAMKSWLVERRQQRQAEFKTSLKEAALVNFNDEGNITAKHKRALEEFFAGALPASALPEKLGKNGAAGAPILALVRNKSPLLHWGAEESDGSFKPFPTLIEEIEEQSAGGHQLETILARINGRRDKRNGFFHSQDQTGFSIDAPDCLLSLTDLFALCESLWGKDYSDQVQAKPVLRAQVAVIRLKQLGDSQGVAVRLYEELIDNQNQPRLNRNSGTWEYLLLSDDATTFFARLKTHYEQEVIRRRDRIRQIDALRNIKAEHRREQTRLREEIPAYTQIIRVCLDPHWQDNEEI